MTLWESAEINKCIWCGSEAKVWSPSQAWVKGENMTTEGMNGTRYIDPTFKGYEKICNVCRHDDIEFRFKEAEENRKAKMKST